MADQKNNIKDQDKDKMKEQQDGAIPLGQGEKTTTGEQPNMPHGQQKQGQKPADQDDDEE